ncbi:hypothetical protein COCNU_08G000890 [Cocos nucifera]|uniref:Uncharacterized protein n=1 Tax=Cocos nucifera TaxID=13894 RepID=A0A8K0IGP5_COCNU|nr:hypothetical protein COCNU_08G000890 [Cocos nucifera]
MKFGASEAELPLEYVTKEAFYKDFTGGEMKLGRTHDRPKASEAELPLEYDSKKAPTKGHEVLPHVSEGDGMKFDRIHDLLSASKDVICAIAEISSGRQIVAQQYDRKNREMRIGIMQIVPDIAEWLG